MPRILPDLVHLRKYLIEEGIIVRDLQAGNFAYKRLNGQNGKLMIIDGVGNNEFIPFCNFSPYLARKKIIRKWNRFIHKLNAKHTCFSKAPLRP